MSDIVTGARARLSFQGVQAGYATNVMIRESIDYQPVEVLDSIHVVEHAPVGYTVNGSADMIRVVMQSLKAKGIFPKQGQNAAAFLRNILTGGELSMLLEDTQTNQIIAKVEGVRITESSTSVQARGISANNVSFVGRFVRDEGDLAG